MAQYFLFGGSNSAHDALVTMQYEWQEKLIQR
jgi:hypothetical protein